jgi:exoribonuclease R
MDTIESNGLFYKLSSDTRTDFVKNEMYYKVLPGDTITYNKLDNGQVIIEGIVSRASRVTIGILDTKLRLLRLPLESKLFKTQTSYIFNASIKICLCLVLIDNKQITIIKEYGPITDRKNDLEMCQEVYRNIVDDDFYRIYNNLQSSITHKKPFYSLDHVVDNTHLHTFNIDPTHSLDFDDAISIDLENKRLYIHIVDIHTNLLYTDFEYNAMALGSTLYLPEANLNLFHPDYSENHFSLLQGQSRPVITLEIKLDSSGDGISYRIYKDTIIIKQRYDYYTALKALEDGEKHLVFLDKLLENPKWIYSKLDVPKRTISIFNNSIASIEITNQNRINKIVESLMIATNRIVTTHLINIAPERFHESSDINNIPIVDSLSSIELLKKYKLAKYSASEKGHFALNIPHYTHFTSPIRRAFDILIHNILSGIIYGEQQLKEMIRYINSRDRLNTKIADFYERCKLLSYFSVNKGPYNFKVSNVSRAGIHIFIDSIMYSEFVHISKIIPNVRWTFVEGTNITDSTESTTNSSNKLIGIGNGGENIVIQKLTSGTVTFNTINWLDLCVDTFKIVLNS